MTAANGERSFWAWGYADKLPDEDARRALAAQVAAMLGGSDLGPRPLPRIEDAKLPEPRVLPPPELAGFASASAGDRARRTYGKGYRISSAPSGSISRRPPISS
jgi:alkyldihydroxyacetonephosphate synthase